MKAVNWQNVASNLMVNSSTVEVAKTENVTKMNLIPPWHGDELFKLISVYLFVLLNTFVT